MKRIDKILIVLLYITGIIPLFNTFIPQWNNKIEEFFHFSNGMRAVDFVLLVMLNITLYRSFKGYYKKKSKLQIGIYGIAFTILILFEIIRNINIYGLSAPGEFRFRYLIFVLPFYLALNLKTINSRKWLIKFLIAGLYYIPLCYIPVIGIMKGWTFGAESRFLNSQVYLGMIYTIAIALLADKYKFIRINKLYLFSSLIPFSFFFIVDSHRSAWMSLVIIFIILIYLKEIRIGKFAKFLPAILLMLMLVIPLISEAGLNVSEYVEKRASAFWNPEVDGTSNFRLIMWKLQLEKFKESPLLGEGFGGYWEVTFPNGQKVNVSPHSYYVQTLVKMGVIGLIIYLLIMINIFKKFRYYLKILKNKKEYFLIVMGFSIIITMHFYYTVYSLEYASLIFLGISISSILYQNKNDEKNIYSYTGIQ
jgi:hypothetical protein